MNVKDVEITQDADVSAKVSMVISFKDTIPSISPIEFDEWDNDEKHFISHEWSDNGNDTIAFKVDNKGNIRFELGFESAIYKKMQ